MIVDKVDPRGRCWIGSVTSISLILKEVIIAVSVAYIHYAAALDLTNYSSFAVEQVASGLLMTLLLYFLIG
jgi:hypothetical protein